MTDPDFSPVTGNRIRPVNDCPCSTCAALRSGEPDTTPKEKPPMAATTTVRFEIVDATAEDELRSKIEKLGAEWHSEKCLRERAETDASTVRAAFDKVGAELDATRHQLADALAAVEEWRGLATCREEQLRLLHQDYAGCVGERDAAREESAARGTVSAEIRRQLFEALEDVREWKDAARKTEMTCASVDSIKSERDAARAAHHACEAECELLRKENCDLRDDVSGLIAERDEAVQAVHQWRDEAMGAKMDCDSVRAEIEECDKAVESAITERDAARDSLAMSRATVDHVSAERDAAIQMRDAARSELREAREKHAESLCRLIDERDEARKALADEIARGQNIGIAGCNLKAGSHVVWMDSAELAALRRERDAAQSQWRALQSEIEGRDADRAELDALRARVAELEKTIEAARDNPLTLFGSHSITGRTHAVDRNRSFVGVIVDVSGGKRAHVEALKHIASWL